VRSGPRKTAKNKKKKKKKKSTVVSSKKKSTVMSSIRRQMKKHNPSSGQNGQLVHWWLLIHSGPPHKESKRSCSKTPLGGWSELAATNALVADEPVEAVFRMNENPILPARIFYFFPPLLYPKIFPPPTSPLLPAIYLPPPTYHLPPPSLHRQSSRDVERE